MTKSPGQAAESNEQLFYEVFNACPMGILVENLEGQPLFVNPTLCSMLGFTQEELLGKHCVDFSPPEDAEKDWALFQQLRAGAIDHYQLDKRYFRRDGSLMWGRLSISLLDRRPPPRVVALVEDITDRKRVEEALRDSEERFRLAMGNIAAGVYTEDQQGLITYMNPAAENMFEWTNAELLGKRMHDVIHYKRPDGTPFPASECAILQVLQEGIELREYEDVFIRKDGSFFPVICSSSPLRKEGKVIGIVVGFRDDTQRREAERTLRESERELREAQRLAHVGNWHWDAKNDVVTWSEELYRIGGRDPLSQAPSYKEHPQVYTSESWSRLSAAVERALGSAEPYELDLEMVRPDQTTRWITARGEAVRDAGGLVVGLRGTVQDVTERKRTEEALRESEARLRLAVRAGRMYAFDWDVTTDVIIRSEEVTHIARLAGEPTRLTKQELLARVHPADVATFNSAITECTPDSPDHQISFRLLRPDGSALWLERTGHAFFDEQGKMVRMIAMVADITERKLAEGVLSTVSQKLIQAQDQERASIARELHDDTTQRIALAAVSLDRLEHDHTASPDEVKNGIEDVRKQLLELVEDVQKLSHRLHSSKLEQLGLRKAAASLCKEFSERHKVKVEFHHENVPEDLSADISLSLFRVLQEGLQNAFKHSESTDFQVSLTGGPNQIQLAVRDSGKGFDPLEVRKAEGIGLASMQERLKLVNGHLSIDSHPQQGTTITASVPLSPRAKSMDAA